jgi:ankyrin repeat protein
MYPPPLPKLTKDCAELEHLSHMPPKEAASKCGLIYLKDILQHDARSTWLLKEVRANIELSGKGVVGTGYGYSLIHAFADWGYLLAAQLLIEKGVDIEARTKVGETPLILASESGMESTAKMLLERGANIEATGDDEATPLLRAIRHSRIKLVKLLLKNNANIEASDSEGDTALNLAVMYSNEEMVKYLLKKGANHEAQNNDGRTALLCAVTKGRHKNVEILLELGVDVDAKDRRGRSALNYAMGQHRNGTIAKMLQDEKRLSIRKEPNWFQKRLTASKISDA